MKLQNLIDSSEKSWIRFRSYSFRPSRACITQFDELWPIGSKLPYDQEICWHLNKRGL